MFKIRGHVANGLEMIRDLCRLDSGIRAASVHLHSQRMLISYWFPRTSVCDDGLSFMVVTAGVMV